MHAPNGSCPFGYGSANGSSNSLPPVTHPAPTTHQPAPADGPKDFLPPVNDNFTSKNKEDAAEGRPNIYYGDYLQLDKILNAQHPESWKKGKHCHDEHLFITVHQTYELWFKQVLVEIDSVIDFFAKPTIDDKNLAVCISRMNRIVEIMKLLVDQIHIIETMQPQDFLEFREFLYPASGFQSFQFRILENKLGLFADRQYQNKPVFFYLSEAHQEVIKKGLNSPSLMELVQQWLERTPFLEIGDFNFWKAYGTAVHDMLARDRAVIQSNPLIREETRHVELENVNATEQNFRSLLDEKEHQTQVQQGRRKLSHKATMGALLIFLYRDEPLLQNPHRFLSLMCDLDEHLQIWRYKHMMMAHRMIGTKIGTGGSSGYGYLQKTIRSETYRACTDLFNLSSFLLPRSALPPLPPSVVQKLQFHYA